MATDGSEERDVLPALGMKLDAIPTEEVAPLAREIERRGFDEVWVCEDLGRNGGIAQAALALAATERCRVGIGILPAAVRNVAYLAMEIASLCPSPRRLLAGPGPRVAELAEAGRRPSREPPRLPRRGDAGHPAAAGRRDRHLP